MGSAVWGHKLFASPQYRKGTGRKYMAFLDRRGFLGSLSLTSFSTTARASAGKGCCHECENFIIGKIQRAIYGTRAFWLQWPSLIEPGYVLHSTPTNTNTSTRLGWPHNELLVGLVD